MDDYFLFFLLLATWCDMCWACAPKPRCHGSYMMAFSCYKTRSSSKRPVGFYLCLAYFEALDPPSCLPFGAHCVTEEVTERAVSLAALPPPFILVCLDTAFPVILDRQREKETKKYIERWRVKGRGSWQTMLGRVESIKAHQIKNSCTLKVTNIGWGGQSCQGLDVASSPPSSAPGLSSSSYFSFSLLLAMCVYKTEFQLDCYSI